MKKALFALAVGGFGIGMTEFVIMGILPDVAQALNITIPQAGHFISAYALGVVVGAPLLTSIGNRWPAHKVLFVLMIWFTTFNSLSAMANSYFTLLIMRFLSGLPHGAFFGIGAVVAGNLAQKGKEARAISMMFAGLTVANVIGVPLGTWVGHAFGWKLTFLIVGFIGIATLLSLKAWIPTLAPSSDTGFLEDLKIFKRLEMWLVILLTTIGTGGFFAWYSYIAPLLTEVAGQPEWVITYAMVIAGLGMTVGNLLGAKLADTFTPINAILGALISMVSLLILLSFIAESSIAVLIMTFLIGVNAFCLAAPVQLTMINTAEGSEMLGSSINQSCFNIGNATGAYLAGLPIAYGYGFTSADLVGAALAFCGILITLTIIMVRSRNISFAGASA